MTKNRFITSIGILMVILLLISGCGKSNAANSDTAEAKDNKKLIRIGFNAGPYIDEFKQGVAPYLEKKGYKIKYINFTDGIQPNVAVAQGKLDVNVFQHTLYLQSINKRESINLVPVVQVPTPPMGLYSKKHHSLTEVKPGSTVALPNDPVNMARALNLLKDIGWITIKKNVDPIKTSLQDIKTNPKKIDIKPMESAQGPRVLDDIDFVAIQGNFAVSSGLKLTSAFQLEHMTSPYINVVAVNEKNKNAQFVKDIVDGYHSAEFKKVIETQTEFKGYTLPSYFK